jgi:hypothetical protein
MQNTEGATCWILMAHSCHPNYLVGWGQKDHSLRPHCTNSSGDLSLNSLRKISLRYLSSGRAISERQALCSSPSPTKTKQKNREKTFIFHMNLPNYFIWLSLLGLWCHSFSPHYTTIRGYLILSRSSNFWILRLNWSPFSTLRYVNLLFPVVVTEINTVLLHVWHDAFNELLLS